MHKGKIVIDSVDYDIVKKIPIDSDWHRIDGIEDINGPLQVKIIPIINDEETVEIHIIGGAISFQQLCQKEIPYDFWIGENNCFYVMATRDNQVLILKNSLTIQEYSFAQLTEKQASTK